MSPASETLDDRAHSVTDRSDPVDLPRRGHRSAVRTVTRRHLGPTQTNLIWHNAAHVPDTIFVTPALSASGSADAPDAMIRETMIAPIHLHKVYILRCAHCQTFFTDRGMRAILLLRPDIVLYSTDVVPANVGPLYARDSESASNDMADRTCDCTSQSLGCYTCGGSVGYHIVTPCSRCIETSDRSERSANGHRYVFHCGEVVAEERRYHPSEIAKEIVSIPWATGDAAERTMPLGSKGHAPVSLSVPRETSIRMPSVPKTGDQVYWCHLSIRGGQFAPTDPASRTHSLPEAGR